MKLWVVFLALQQKQGITKCDWRVLVMEGFDERS
jgi:hypothetical protein